MCWPGSGRSKKPEFVMDGWSIHRRIGMSGGLYHPGGRPRDRPAALGGGAGRRSCGVTASSTSSCFRSGGRCRAPELLRAGSTTAACQFGIATSGLRPDIDASLAVLGVPPNVIVIDRGDVLRAKPEPDLFIACQERMGVRRDDCYVVGDAVWDLLAARRAGMLSVGLLSGGYGEDELTRAGAFRVYLRRTGAARLARRAGGHAAWLIAGCRRGSGLAARRAAVRDSPPEDSLDLPQAGGECVDVVPSS
jgi:hypothetical protein